MASHYVKLARGGWETVLLAGNAEECAAHAAKLNEQYQTDEYYVEPYDPAKAWVRPDIKDVIEKLGLRKGKR